MISKALGRKPRNLKVILSGGIGNQLFMLFAALDIGYLKHCEIRAYSPRTSKGFRLHGSSIEAFDLSGLIEYEKLPFKFRFRHRVISFMHRKFPFLSRFLISFTNFYDSPVLGSDRLINQLRNGATIKGYFQTYLHFQNFRRQNPSIELNLTSPSQDFLQLEEFLHSKMLTVIHVRLGDYLLHMDSVGVLSKQYFSKALKVLELNNSNVVVFSDDIETARQMISSILPKETTWLGKDHLSAEESLALMWGGNQFILSNSSFGYWGALLAKEPIRVIAPSKWFKGEDDPSNLIPPQWERVESSWKSK